MRKGPEREADAAEANLPIGERRARERNGPSRAERTVGAKCDATSDRHLSTTTLPRTPHTHPPATADYNCISRKILINLWTPTTQQDAK